jgi:hypothetical protein
MGIYVNCWLQLFDHHRTIFSIVDKLPSWSDADDSLESISGPEEDEDDVTDHKDSKRSICNAGRRSEPFGGIRGRLFRLGTGHRLL